MRPASLAWHVVKRSLTNLCCPTPMMRTIRHRSPVAAQSFSPNALVRSTVFCLAALLVHALVPTSASAGCVEFEEILRNVLQPIPAARIKFVPNSHLLRRDAQNPAKMLEEHITATPAIPC